MDSVTVQIANAALDEIIEATIAPNAAELGVEPRFRDSLAARVMAPTTDALYDFVGRATLGLPLFGAA